VTATVLMIGEGGQLGAPVARRLEDGFGVQVLVRANSPARADGRKEVLGDVDYIDSLRRALTGCDAVHISLRGGPGDADYERVEHSRGTARVENGPRTPQLCIPHARCSRLAVRLAACEVECRTRHSGQWGAVHDLSSDLLHRRCLATFAAGQPPCSAVSGSVSTCSLRRISPPWCPAR
jgi:hypothetical protein